MRPAIMRDSLGKKEVEAFLRQKQRWKTRFFSFKILPSTLFYPRVAFAFSRKLGHAVLRNRFRRRIRELVRLLALELKGVDILCTAYVPLAKISDADWREEKKRIGALLLHKCQTHE